MWSAVSLLNSTENYSKKAINDDTMMMMTSNCDNPTCSPNAGTAVHYNGRPQRMARPWRPQVFGGCLLNGTHMEEEVQEPCGWWHTIVRPAGELQMNYLPWLARLETEQTQWVVIVKW